MSQQARERRAEKGSQEGKVEVAERKVVQEGQEVEEEERKEAKIEVTRLRTPIPSKRQQDVLRAIVDMYLRLRSDGYAVSQIHTDRGGEFLSDAWIGGVHLASIYSRRSTTVQGRGWGFCSLGQS